MKVKHIIFCMKKITLWFLVLLLGYYLLRTCVFADVSDKMVARVEKNYGADVEAACEKYDLPPEYLKALIALESSGHRPAKSRFEKHVYRKLKEVRDGERRTYAKLTQKNLQGRDDNELRLMATSWGPVQVMGYYTVELGVTVDDLKGERAVFHAANWCKRHYGKYLAKGDFRNAFHIHNTGRPHPEWWFSATFDPNYVKKGLNYLFAFR